MSSEEALFVCHSCGLEKTVSPEKLKFFAEKGYEQEPMFCETCINARLDQIWETPGERRCAICSDCGCETRLNFVPCKELPVYCPKCYKKHSEQS
ncbi:MAG: zinc-ribbon domain containing protein [Candidatus Riflebacteria bacterium]|nr:zinc-ribbon domain containing protein [Candidatus Riflebacteria bacterium]